MPPENELLAPNVVLSKVPTLVIFGCAAVVTVPAVVAVVAVAAAKLATVVVEVTTNGEVPVAMFDINRVAVTIAVEFRLPTLALPDTMVNVVVFLLKVKAATPLERPESLN